MALEGRGAWWHGWRLALRLARRDAARSRARSALVLLMIALPVTAVTCAATLQATQSVSAVEGLDRRIGGAQALVTIDLPAGPVAQLPDPQDGAATLGATLPAGATVDAATIREVVPGARTLPWQRGDGVVGRAGTTGGSGPIVLATLLATDLRDPAAAPLVRLESGRLPARDCEVVVSPSVASGLEVGLGDPLALRRPTDACPRLQVVGIADDADRRDVALVAGLPSALPTSRASRGWLVVDAPVSWAQVQRLNAGGALVVSRAVITDPPPTDSLPPQVAQVVEDGRAALLAVVALIATMVLVQVVLLAGPAFAVGARRRARDLALIATAGGTPAQARCTVLATAIVLGGLASVGGGVLGVALARVLVGPFQATSDTWLGPFQVPGRQIVVVAALGLLSALLAAGVPALVASRQDVVAVLAGRRADAPPSRRSPIGGVLLAGLGVLGSWRGAVAGTGGGAGADTLPASLLITGSAILAVLGMVLLTPAAVAVTARLAGRLPLPLRYAARDAARHRLRSASAVAAVAATVAGVVALGIGLTSDDAQSRAAYEPRLPAGYGSVVTPIGMPEQRWAQVGAAITAADPAARVQEMRGVVAGTGLGLDVAIGGFMTVRADATPGQPLLRVAARTPGDLGLPSEAAGRIDAVLASGRMAVLTRADSERTVATITASPYTDDLYADPGASPSAVTRRVPARAVVVRLPGDPPLPALGIAPPGLLEAHGLRTGTAGLVWSRDAEGATGRAAEQRIAAAAVRAQPSAEVYVERGPQQSDELARVRLVLIGLATALVLGGTLTATLLALSDAAPDLATLGAVGASSRLRALVAGGHALLVGGLGAVLGLGVGLVPGIAITYPLTAVELTPAGTGGGHVLAIPWTLIAVVVLGLPLAVAAVAAGVGALGARGPQPRRPPWPGGRRHRIATEQFVGGA